MDPKADTAPSAVSEQAAEDAALVQRVLAGDLRAFDDLVTRYQRRVTSIAFRLLGNSHDSADVCQEVFLRAYRSIEKLTEPHRFAGWLSRIACNLSLNYRRGRKKAMSLSDDDGQAIAEQQTGGAMITVTHDPALSSEAETAIHAAINRLPDKQRMALVLFALEGMPHKEVAEILECSVEAVKWHVFQARKKLKDDLADYLLE